MNTSFEFEEPLSNIRRSGTTANLMYNGKRLCTADTWAFASCAVASLYSMGGAWTAQMVEEFIEWMKSGEAQINKDWCLKEVLFCITAWQRTFEHLAPLFNSEYVKLVDTFTNKAHGGTRMYLYRISCGKDFSDASIQSSTGS